jgi:hypothetical protein
MRGMLLAVEEEVKHLSLGIFIPFTMVYICLDLD